MTNDTTFTRDLIDFANLEVFENGFKIIFSEMGIKIVNLFLI